MPTPIIQEDSGDSFFLLWGAQRLILLKPDKWNLLILPLDRDRYPSRFPTERRPRSRINLRDALRKSGLIRLNVRVLPRPACLPVILLTWNLLPARRFWVYIFPPSLK
ncbi:hypothetical protein C8J57DRAFT_1248238 [Mycena rebaudengoi]|nr:hypothetical protein C8J57DRAFT_1248238 [Mycena rebaudengoi]